MSKVNGIGISARDIDQIIDRAIQLIGAGEYKYSCCALTAEEDYHKCWKVRQAYTRIFGPHTDYLDNHGYEFARKVKQATNAATVADFRVFMLSLFKAAWRDLV